MKPETQPVQESKTSPTLNESVACDVCGRFGAYRFGERLLCQECYAGSGSCCPEFGKDDLWTFQDDYPCPTAPRGSVPANKDQAGLNLGPALNAQD